MDINRHCKFLTTLTLLTLVCVCYSSALPTENTLVVTTFEQKNVSKESSPLLSPSVKINEIHVTARVRNRYAVTTIRSKIKNYDTKPKQAAFSVILPDSAFISNFTMEINGQNYSAYVKEKEEAKKIYDEAVALGNSAAHVATARDSNRFTISINVEPETKAVFYLTYEELLKRQNGRYQLVINLHPGELVRNLDVVVEIAESRKLIDVKVPPIRTGNEIRNDNNDLDSRAVLQIVNDTSAVIKFAPNVERQKALAYGLGMKEDEGLAGQFVVEYDVERDPVGGEVLIQDGYFVHFFAPKDVEPLLKYVVFVLDTSSSMWGQMIQQLKEAMHKVLSQLHPNDLFHLVEFNTNVRVWNLNNYSQSTWFPTADDVNWVDSNGPEDLVNFNFPDAYMVNAENIAKAKESISKFEAVSATDINTALQVGLYLVKITKQNNKHPNHQPIIMFLTDGEPTVRETSTEKILNGIRKLNERNTPIFALSFGEAADKNFLQKLSLNNNGFSKHIYEGADAALQLEEFYRQISSPLLANVTFKYEPSVTSLTKTEFPIHFDGAEMVVAGCYDSNENVDESFGNVTAWNGSEMVSMNFTVQRSVSSIERLWAYLSVKQLLDQKEVNEDNKTNLQKKALELALNYSFVTPVSSLVVVKPNATSNVDVENAKKGDEYLALTDNRFGGVPLTAGLHFDFDYDESRDTPDYNFKATTQASPDLFTMHPWISAVLDEDGFITLPKGKYNLGLNEIIPDVVNCEVNKKSGFCKLLNACPQASNVVRNLDDYISHFCELKDEYYTQLLWSVKLRTVPDLEDKFSFSPTLQDCLTVENINQKFAEMNFFTFVVMEHGGFPAQHSTTTTVTRVQTNIRYDPSYIKTKDGILKIVEIALSFIGFISVQCSQFSIHPTGKWYSTVSMFGVWITGILLLFYLFHIIEKLYKIPWIKFELFFCAIIALCFLIASSMVAPLGIPAFEAGAFFGFAAMVAYAVDTYFKYVAMRSGALAQGERQITKETTVTTPKY
ncbi:hypothetical protein FQR65_LT06669 [Abscondita terminalis]|nr:hypothetical protein FQR65_LT06669 [Abscondita terminalis]